MNNSKPETTVATSAKPEIANPTVNDTKAEPVTPPKPMSDDEKKVGKLASAAPTSSTR